MNKIFFSLVLGMFSAFSVLAQDLPTLPSDPAIHQGTLPNGTRWMISVNPAERQTADFALVQKVGTRTPGLGAKSRELAGRNMSALPHFRKQTPVQFLASKGIMPGKEGYVKVTDEATIYRFPDVLMYDEKSVTDSTLLLIFDIINESASAESDTSGCYAPSEQTILISGDVNKDGIVSKMYDISLMVNAMPSVEGIDETRGERTLNGPAFQSDTHKGNLAALSFEWQFPRTPDNLMPTVQPVLMEIVMDELGIMATGRIRENLRLMDIPYSKLAWKFIPSARTSGNEIFAIDLMCPDDKVEGAVGVVAGALASLASAQASVREFVSCKDAAVAMMSSAVETQEKENAAYIDRCIDAILNNAPLSSTRQKIDFYASRVIEDETELNLFNSVVSASLLDFSGLTVSCRATHPVPTERIQELFHQAWDKAQSQVHSRPYSNVAYSDLPPVPQKFKVVSSKTDPTSGSSIWIFSNGFTVVYKKMPTEGKLYCSLVMNGGFGNIPGLVQGEGAFYSDYLNLCMINGCRGVDFFQALQDDGVSLSPEVSLANTKISGIAPAEKFPLLMNALISISNCRTLDAEEYPFYRECQQLIHEPSSSDYRRMSEIDRILCPDNKFSVYADPHALSEGFLNKAESLFGELTAKMDDGALVIVGDISEYVLKKELLGYVHCFKTAQKAFPRSQYRYQPVSGTSVYTVEGDRDVVDIVISAPYPMTSDNIISSSVAELLLKRHLAAPMAQAGFSADVDMAITSHPQERINLRISASRDNPFGFGSGFRQADVMEVLALLRGALSSLNDFQVDEQVLKACKAAVKRRVESELSDPSWWVGVLSTRFLGGKDIYSNVSGKADAVTAGKVSAIFKALSEGCRVEYVTEKK